MVSYISCRAAIVLALLLTRSGAHARPFGLPEVGQAPPEASKQAATLLVTKSASFARKTGSNIVDIVYVDEQDDDGVDAVMARLLSEDGVETVELDRPAEPVQEMIPERGNLPNDPEFGSQWHLPFIRAPQAWAYATGSSEIKVCVVDSGVASDHPDLEYNLNHFQGDHTFRNSDSDSTGHGTHVAGIIAAKGNNQLEVSGINWNVNLISCRFLDDGGGLVSNAIICMNWCADQGATIINNSWTTAYSVSALEATMKDLESRGVIFVTAAANQGANLEESPDAYPASFQLSNQIVVGALDSDGKLADYSNFGPSKVHVAAPGSNILSLDNCGGLKRLWGTSCSAPMVTGTLALMADASRSEIPMNRLKEILLDTYRYDASLEDRVQAGRVLDTGKAVRVAREEYLQRMLGTGRVARA